jgi:CheY-like chemotaxis protein
MKDDPTVDFSSVPWLETRSAAQIVLVVDDHPGTCEITVKLIKMLGYFARCVMSGHEALEFAASHPVGLILLDVMMPIMDGMETLVRIQSDPALKSIPVVMHSALSDDLMRTKAIETGAKDFLVKGDISLERLRGVLESYLRPPG